MSTEIAVVLRDASSADVPIFFEHQLDPEATAMAAFPARERDAFAAHWEKVLADETATTKTILADGRVAGNIACWPVAGEPHVGYWVGKEYWNRGVATKALRAFLEVVPMRPLYARVAKHNAGSIRVLDKCGFSAVGEDTGPDGVVELVMRLP